MTLAGASALGLIGNLHQLPYLKPVPSRAARAKLSLGNTGVVASRWFIELIERANIIIYTVWTYLGIL